MFSSRLVFPWRLVGAARGGLLLVLSERTQRLGEIAETPPELRSLNEMQGLRDGLLQVWALEDVLGVAEARGQAWDLKLGAEHVGTLVEGLSAQLGVEEDASCQKPRNATYKAREHKRLRRYLASPALNESLRTLLETLDDASQQIPPSESYKPTEHERVRGLLASLDRRGHRLRPFRYLALAWASRRKL